MRAGKLSTRWCMILCILPILTGFICLCIGRIAIPLPEVLGAFTGHPGVSVMTRMTVWNLRLPRILLAALAGAGLSAAGCAFQSLFANPLATPDTLGVASGASFGAALGLLLGLPLLGVQLSCGGSAPWGYPISNSIPTAIAKGREYPPPRQHLLAPSFPHFLQKQGWQQFALPLLHSGIP